MYITVLNQATSTVDILSVTKDSLTPEETEDILEFRGYNVNQCQYMVSHEISVNIL